MRAWRLEFLKEQEAEQPKGLWLIGHKLRQQPSQTDRLGAEFLANQLVAGARAVALVEKRVDHCQHRAQPLLQMVRIRHAIWNACLDNLALGARQPLRHRLLREQEGPCYLGCRQTRECAKRQRHLSLDRERWVTAREHQPKPIVVNPAVVVVVMTRCGSRHSNLPELGFAHRVSSHPVQCTISRSRFQPGCRTRWNPIAWPASDRPLERILGALLGQVPIAGNVDQVGDDATPVGPEGLVDRRLRIG